MAHGNGIQWMMELDAKLDGAKAMIKELTATEKAADDADRALKKMDHPSQHMWKEIMKGELAMKALEKGAELAWESIKKVVETGADMIKVAVGAERTSKVFENMLGKSEGKETLDYLEKFAELSEFTGAAVKGAGNELLRAGLRGADFRNAMGAAVDVAAQAPDKMEGLQEAVASFSRIALMGKVDARTLRGLRLDPHAVADQLSKDLGLSKETIKKQLTEGTLDGVKAMQSIFTVMERKTGKQLGGLGQDMADNMGARLEKLKEIPDEIFKSVKDTPGFAMLNDALGEILEAFGPSSASGKAVRAALGDLVNFVGKEIKEIDWKSVADGFASVVERAREWIEPLEKVVKLLGSMAGFVLDVGAIFGGSGGDTPHVMSADQARDTPHVMSADQARDMQELFLKVGMRAGQKELNEGPVNALNAPWKQEAKNIVDGAGQVLAAGGEKIGGTFGDGASKGFATKLEIESPSKVFARHGEMIAEGLAQGMESGSDRVSQASASVMPTPDTSGLRGGAGGFNAGGVTLNFEVNVGGGSQSSASEIVDELNTRLPSVLLAALEQAAVEAAVA
jgi:hypothetical protein